LHGEINVPASVTGFSSGNILNSNERTAEFYEKQLLLLKKVILLMERL
jgi:hypothetical protein